jgi:beta-fructofuranosidase
MPLADRPLDHVEYFVGDLDRNRFRARSRGRLDAGDALYAPAVMVDEQGRHLMWGWAQEALDRVIQERLPVAGALTVPRTLSLDGDVLGMAPAPELLGLRGGLLLEPPADGVPRPLPARSARHLELEAVLDRTDGVLDVRLASTAAGAELRVAAYLFDRLEVTVTGPAGRRRTHRVALPGTGGGPLRVYRDGSLVEVFHGGRAVTTRWYTATLADDWTVTVDGGAGSRVTVWAMRDAFG